jgi:hypothetical protein
LNAKQKSKQMRHDFWHIRHSHNTNLYSVNHGCRRGLEHKHDNINTKHQGHCVVASGTSYRRHTRHFYANSVSFRLLGAWEKIFRVTQQAMCGSAVSPCL